MHVAGAWRHCGSTP
jgi:hypothetical protein